jgi:hypothetical protein
VFFNKSNRLLKKFLDSRGSPEYKARVPKFYSVRRDAARSHENDATSPPTILAGCGAAFISDDPLMPTNCSLSWLF